MRAPQSVLFLVALLLASVTITVANDSMTNKPEAHIITSIKHGFSTTRLLRTHPVAGEDGGERAGANSLTSLIKTGKSKINDAVKLRVWLIKEKSAADVLTKLKLNERADKALASPNLKVLINYLDMFNKKYQDRQASLLGTLVAHYGDDAVAKALVTAKLADNTKEIATKLQLQQLNGWLDSKKSVVDVFKILKLGNDEHLAMMSRKLETLGEYVTLYNLKNPQAKTDMLSTLSTGFGGDAKLSIVVSKAMSMPQSSAMYEAALKYQNALFTQWAHRELDPMDVLTKVFNKDKLASAGPQVKWIVKQYKKFFRSESRVADHVPGVVNPRRS